MSALFRLSGATQRDPTIEEWLHQSDASTALARTWFRKMRACGEDVPFAYVDVFKSHTNEGTGKNMRHVKLKPGVEPNPTALGALIHAAYLDVKARLKTE